jgi:exonuclease VII small subunit
MDWQERVNTHPDDQEVQVLHALWMGLCFKVETGDLALDDAITIFENARSTLIQQRQEENRAKKEAAPLSGTHRAEKQSSERTHA